MLGAILGLASAAVFGVNNNITRRGLLWSSSSYIANISIFTGPIFFLLATLVTGDIFRLREFCWRAYLFFAIAGVVHFALGRTWSYRSVKLIGVTRSSIVTSMNFVVTIVLAMIIFHETLKPLMVVGILLASAGPFIMSRKEATKSTGAQSRPRHAAEVDRPTLYKGIFFSMGAALFWGSSAIFIKLGLDSGGHAVLGNLVAYVAASIVISPSAFLGMENRKEMFKTSGKALQLALLSGLTSDVAQMLRFLALEYGSVIVVSMMQRTGPVWLLLFAYLMNRQYESLSRWVLLGNGLLMVGSFLVLIS